MNDNNLNFLRYIEVKSYSENQEKIFSNDFRIDFDISYNRNSTKNKSTIKLYNLKYSTSMELAKKFNRIELVAGYKNRHSTIFIGDVTKATISKSGTDTITTLELSAGEKSLMLATSSRTFDAGTLIEDVVRELASDFPDVTIGNIIVDDYKLSNDPNILVTTANYYIEKLEDIQINRINELIDSGKSILSRETLNEMNAHTKTLQEIKVLKKKYVVAGSTKEELDNLAKAYNGSWTIVNNVFQWVDNSRSNDQIKVIEISGESGMIGYPEIDDKGANVEVLLNPYLNVNELVNLKSKFGSQKANILNESSTGGFQGEGVFRINDIKHKGSNYTNDFFTILTLQKTIVTDDGKNRVVNEDNQINAAKSIEREGYVANDITGSSNYSALNAIPNLNRIR